MARENQDRLSYVPQLDGVRGIACLMVLIAHLQAVQGLHWMHDKIATAGVGLFFVLSGFLITRILIADKEQGRGLNTFYNRRAARILPIYFLTLIALALFWPGKELGWAATFSFNLRYVTNVREYFHIDAGTVPIPPIAHVWSLCVEEHFYWFWPALVWLLPTRFYRWLPLLCIAATPGITNLVIRQLSGHGFRGPALEGLVSRLTLTQLVGLSLGALAAIYEKPLRQKVRVFRVRVPLLALLGGVLLLASAGAYLRLRTSSEHDRLLWQTTLLHLACGGVFAVGLSITWLGKIGWLNRVGRISYGLYLYHLPIYAAFGLAQSGSGVSPWRGLAALSATFALAAVSFRFLEAPLLAWARKQGDGPLLGRGRVAISLGTAAAVLMAATCTGQTAMLFHDHPMIPAKWQYAEIRVRDNPDTYGASYAYRWMGVVHVLDKDGFRRTTPIPAKVPGVPRVATVGNSYTWGACVDADQVLALMTERLLREQGISMEVLNLGKQGGHVEDTLKVVRENVVPLQPNVVVYAATTNCFLSAGEGWGNHSLKEILSDPTFANRFRDAIRAMDAACRECGAILLIMPFTQQPDHPDSVAIVQLIEKLCTLEGVPLIRVDDYIHKYSNRSFGFSRWDSHPTAECHRLHAEMLCAKLLSLWKRGEIPTY